MEKREHQTESNKPQFHNDQQAPGYDNDVPADSWLRSDGTKKPDFDHISRRGKR